MPLLPILLVILVGCVLLWAARALMAAFGVGDPIATVVYVVLVILVVFYAISVLSGGGPVLTSGTLRLK